MPGLPNGFSVWAAVRWLVRVHTGDTGWDNNDVCAGQGLLQSIVGWEVTGNFLYIVCLSGCISPNIVIKTEHILLG